MRCQKCPDCLAWQKIKASYHAAMAEASTKEKVEALEAGMLAIAKLYQCTESKNDNGIVQAT